MQHKKKRVYFRDILSNTFLNRIPKPHSFPNRLCGSKRLYCALGVVRAPFLSRFFHLSHLIFGKKQVNQRSWVSPEQKESLTTSNCSSVALLPWCLSVPDIITKGFPKCRFILPQAVIPCHPQNTEESEMIPVTFFPLLQHHPKPQLVVPDLGSCKRREFSPQAEDTPVTVVTPHAPRRCFSSLGGEYAESPQILVL